jgi:hypothetical protein
MSDLHIQLFGEGDGGLLIWLAYQLLFGLSKMDV